jgi:hypothetical protein
MLEQKEETKSERKGEKVGSVQAQEAKNGFTSTIFLSPKTPPRAPKFASLRISHFAPSCQYIKSDLL